MALRDSSAIQVLEDAFDTLDKLFADLTPAQRKMARDYIERRVHGLPNDKEAIPAAPPPSPQGDPLDVLRRLIKDQRRTSDQPIQPPNHIPGRVIPLTPGPSRDPYTWPGHELGRPCPIGWPGIDSPHDRTGWETSFEITCAEQRKVIDFADLANIQVSLGNNADGRWSSLWRRSTSTCGCCTRTTCRTTT